MTIKTAIKAALAGMRQGTLTKSFAAGALVSLEEHPLPTSVEKFKEIS